ncbi:hypothetical protein AB0I84_06090 [Streptomyces spectabilis]|uniref:hypothetical protein n=1 Tax=Streptomyces spectabilis TaxID=68270 RepID=UPI00340DC404
MSAPAPPRRPSPADMPRHPLPHPAIKPTASPTGFTTTPAPATAAPAPAADGRASAEAALTPGKLQPGENFRSVYRRAMFMSGLRPEARLVAHTLVWYANHLNGHISPNHQPSLERLAADTGLTPGRVKVQTQILWQRGWLRRRPILEGPRKGRIRISLTVPAVYLERVRDARALPRSLDR